MEWRIKARLFLVGVRNMEQKYLDAGWQPVTLEIGVVASWFEDHEIWKLTGFSADIDFLSLFDIWV